MAAIARGYFADENLTVVYSLFASSRTAFGQMMAGSLEIVVSAADNVANFRINPNNPLGAATDAQIIFQHDGGLGLVLAALPAYTTVESLRGKRIAVDTPGSGFALVAAKIFREHGLEAGADYTMVAAGGSPSRLAGLRATPPTWDAAIINADSSVRARADGFSIVAVNLVDPYSGGVGVASESWLKANDDVAVRFLRAYTRGVAWLEDAHNRDAAIALVVDADTAVPLATQIYEAALARTGTTDRGRLSRRGLFNVLAMRDEFGGFEIPQDIEFLASPSSGLYDLSYLHEALAHGHERHQP